MNRSRSKLYTVSMQSLRGLVVVFPLLLVACNNSNPPTVVVRPNPNGTTQIETMQVKLRTSMSSRTSGFSQRSPEGLVASYKFEANGIKTRMDMPSSVFPDGRGRIGIFDTGSKSMSVFYSDSQLQDQTLNPKMLSGLADGLGTFQLSFRLLDQKKPFARLSADQFLLVAKNAAFDISENTPKQLTFKQSVSQSDYLRNTRIVFDVELGAISLIEDTSINKEVTQTSVSEIQYTTPTEMPNTLIPYEVDTKVTIRLNNSVPVQTRPEARVLPEGQTTPQLGEGEFIANVVKQVPGGNQLDPNVMTVEQKTRFETVEVNGLNADFFTLGGQK
jgi:hypothetical protein